MPALTHAAVPREDGRLEVGGRTLALLLLGWCGVAWGIADHDGRYTPYALGLVVLGAAVVAAATASLGRAGRPAPRLLPAATVATVALVGVAPLLWHPHYDARGAPLVVSHACMAAAGVLAAGSLLPRLQVRSWPFWTALGLSSAAGVFMIVAAPAPRIDVFALLQGSTSGLTHGADMYRQVWGHSPVGYKAEYTPVGLYDVYPYLPGTSLLLLPFRLLLGDVRYGLVVALALAAVLARRLGGSRLPALLPLLVAVHPKVTYADQQSWTEPLLVAALTGMVLAVSAGRPRVAVACLAVALASKQHIVLLLPVAAMWPAFGPRRTLAAAGWAALAVAGWVLAGPGDFWHDAVLANVANPPLGHALSLPGLAVRYGVLLGFGPATLALAGSYLLAWRARGSDVGFCAGAALVVIALDVTNKQSFFNHYTLAMGLITLAVLVGMRGRRPAFAAGGDHRVVENLSSDSASSSALRVTRTLRSRRAASWSDTTEQVPASVR